jgi:hypothetical protein
MSAASKTVDNYARALRYGTKYIYRTMPRMLTIWMDCGERPDLVKLDDGKEKACVHLASSPGHLPY